MNHRQSGATRSIILSLLVGFGILFLYASAPAEKPQVKPTLNAIKLPSGFSIRTFADNVKNARAMSLGKNGTVFVGSRESGNVYALVDENGDGQADKQYTIASNLKMPVGVAFKDGDLYISAVHQILALRQIENKLLNPPKPEVVYAGFPTDVHHGWKFIAFGPDGKLYVPVGAPCNICNPDDERYASIMRMNKDGSDLEVFAHGVRNSVGFDWDPVSKELWFTDNGRDWLGDDLPPCELNHAPTAGLHFGYPFCHGKDVKDPEFGDLRSCLELRPPAFEFKAHTAPLGMRFYTGEMFPPEYKGRVFIAQHGSWNRSSPIGYRIMVASRAANGVVTAEPFAEGWLKQGKPWGRPVDVLQLPDGSLLVSDDFAGAIYRVTYERSN